MYFLLQDLIKGNKKIGIVKEIQKKWKKKKKKGWGGDKCVAVISNKYLAAITNKYLALYPTSIWGVYSTEEPLLKNCMVRVTIYIKHTTYRHRDY